VKFSLVIPCYNEGQNIPLLVKRCTEIFADQDCEIILVDNGSSDVSVDLLQKLSVNDSVVKSIRLDKNDGYGGGILAGLKAAKGDILGWTHADMQTDPKDALTGFELFMTADQAETLFVKGKRYGRPIADQFFTFGMSIFESFLLRRRLWDINAQPTIFHRNFYESLPPAPKDFSLDLYFYVMAKMRGSTVKRFPVRFGERAHGASHWNVDFSSKIKFIKRTMDFSLKLRKSLSQQRRA